MLNAKKKKVSKKNKSSWRKHINVSDVDEFLEEQRLDERLGFVSELPSNELFHIDTQSPAPLSEKEQRRQRFREKEMKCFSLLVPHTKVPDPIKKRNRVRSKEERKNALVKKKEAERKSKGILKAKERQSLKDKDEYLAKLKSQSKETEFLEDVWESEYIGVGVEKSEWVDDVTKRHTTLNLGSAKKRVGKAADKVPTAIPPVELPHPGLSYNPSLADHQDLLRQVVEKEKKLIKEEKHLERVTKDMLKKIPSSQKEESWLCEMTQGLPGTEHNKDDEHAGNSSENEDSPAMNQPVKNKKKTVKQRRKQKEQLELKKALLEAKREKRKIADIYKLKFIHKQIERNEAKTSVLQEKRKKAELYKRKEAKRLSALKFEEEECDFTTGEDLSGNLRNLKSKGNLLLDRFKSLQKRSILQPTVMQTKKRPKVKKYTKPDRKDGWEKTVARQQKV